MSKPKPGSVREQALVAVLSHKNCAYAGQDRADDSCSIASLCGPCASLVAEIEQIAATPAQRTREPPTRPGWYWARNDQWDTNQIVSVVQVSFGELAVEQIDEKGDVSLSEFDLWAGPIEPPPMPERT